MNFKEIFEEVRFVKKMDVLLGDIDGTETRITKTSDGKEVFEIWVQDHKDKAQVKKVQSQVKKFMRLLKDVYDIEYDGERIAIHQK